MDDKILSLMDELFSVEEKETGSELTDMEMYQWVKRIIEELIIQRTTGTDILFVGKIIEASWEVTIVNSLFAYIDSYIYPSSSEFDKDILKKIYSYSNKHNLFDFFFRVYCNSPYSIFEAIENTGNELIEDIQNGTPLENLG